MLWILPDWLCFYVGLVTVLITAVRLVSRFVKLPHNLHRRYGGGWAVVTGGSDGIGLGFCEELAKLGFNICVISRNKAKIQNVLARLRDMNGKIETKGIVADFGNSLHHGFYENIDKQLQGLDISILVNNVGVLGQIRPFHEYKHEQIHKQLTINMAPAAMMTRLILPRMLSRPQKSGIIFLSSYSTMMRLKHSTTYCATKLFNDVFSRALAYENRDKIDFLSLKPGLVTTEMARNTTSFLHVSKNACAKGALRSLGRYEVYAGSWWHELQNFATGLASEYTRDVLIGRSWQKIGENYKEIDSKKQKNT